MYEVSWDDLLVVHDAHPQYRSTTYATTCRLPKKGRATSSRPRRFCACRARRVGQASAGGELRWHRIRRRRQHLGRRVFAGSVKEGFQRVAHLRRASLPGGDAAAQHPVQAAAGFLAQVEELPDVSAAPSIFLALSASDGAGTQGSAKLRNHLVGRLFDTAAALLGFTRGISFEGQAAMWLEDVARRAGAVRSVSLSVLRSRAGFSSVAAMPLHTTGMRGRSQHEIARAFQRGVAQGLRDASLRFVRICPRIRWFCREAYSRTSFCCRICKELLADAALEIWTNHSVPPNDGGISLGQAALAAFPGDPVFQGNDYNPLPKSDGLETDSPYPSCVGAFRAAS